MNRQAYDFLGLHPNADKLQIQEAYRTRARMLQVQQEQGQIDAHSFEQQMLTLDNAYDSIIMDIQSDPNYTDTSQASNSGSTTGQTTDKNEFSDIEQCISENRLDDADMLLDGTPESMRTAKWYYLKAGILRSRGWLDEAYTHYENAHLLDPDNREYKRAYARMTRSRATGYRRTSDDDNVGCLGNLCTSLLCANLCCSCFRN